MDTHDDEDCDDYAPTEDMTVEEEGIIMRKFIRALMDGDEKGAGKTLRQLPQITGYLKNLLADMLEGSPSLEDRFHWHLKLVSRTCGTPPNSPWHERELEEQAWRTVHKYYPSEIKKLDDKGGAFHHAAKELNWSVGKVRCYYYARNKRNLGLASLDFVLLGAT